MARGHKGPWRVPGTSRAGLFRIVWGFFFVKSQPERVGALLHGASSSAPADRDIVVRRDSSVLKHDG